MNNPVQGRWGGGPTGNGKKLSNSQACCLAQLCLAAASFLSISCGPSTPSALYGAQCFSSCLLRVRIAVYRQKRTRSRQTNDAIQVGQSLRVASHLGLPAFRHVSRLSPPPFGFSCLHFFPFSGATSVK